MLPPLNSNNEVGITHARGNDRKIRPSARAVSLSCAEFNSVVPRKYLYTAKLSLSESVIFLISSRCPFPIPLPVCPGRWQARLARAGEGSSHTDVVLPPSRRLCPSCAANSKPFDTRARYGT